MAIMGMKMIILRITMVIVIIVMKMIMIFSGQPRVLAAFTKACR